MSRGRYSGGAAERPRVNGHRQAGGSWDGIRKRSISSARPPSAPSTYDEPSGVRRRASIEEAASPKSPTEKIIEAAAQDPELFGDRNFMFSSMACSRTHLSGGGTDGFTIADP